MTYRFGLILTLTLVVFAALTSFANSTVTYLQLREQAIENNAKLIRLNEVMAKNALETTEKALQAFGNHIASKMEENTHYLLDLYAKNPSFEDWDFASLKESLSTDIYIINEQNVIVYSNVVEDIGLDFNECCRKMAKELEERRQAGTFFHEVIDIAQNSGKLTKFSYMATPDKKYIIELGYNLEEDEIFHAFNFRDVINRYAHEIPLIKKISVLHPYGFYLGEPQKTAQKLPEERRELFEYTRNTGQTTEFQGVWENEPVTYRYVRYVSKYDRGMTQTKVLEIIYSDEELQTILAEYRRKFYIQLSFILFTAFVISYILTRWVAKPLYLAFHDGLTGLKNRAALEIWLKKLMAKNKGITAVMLIDLDNFKLVNDRLGHDKGDQLLKKVAQCIRRAARKQDIVARLGGDEFVLLMPQSSREEAEQTAGRIIQSLQELTAEEFSLEDVQVTASIGIAFYPEHGLDQEALLKKADIALYNSKEKGKNQYQFYE